MAVNVHYDGDVVILSNFARLMNDPRYVDAANEVHELLEEGYGQFVIELADVRETGGSFLGLLMTITREIRKHRGEVVLARPSAAVASYLAEMRLDEHWDLFATVDEAVAFYTGDEPDQEDR